MHDRFRRPQGGGWTSTADAWVNHDPFPVLTSVMELKTLQLMLLTTLRQQTSLVRMVDLDKFGTCVGFVTRLVLSSRGR